MTIVNAFVGRSFHADDVMPVDKFLKFLNSFKRLGFHWEDAEEAESVSVASKVKEKFKDKDVFIGIFTRRYSFPSKLTKKANPSKKSPFLSFFLSHDFWTTSGWTFQESGYAIAKDLRLIFLVEDGIPDLGGLQGDLNYIPFSREKVEACFADLGAIINKIIAEKSGLQEKQKTPEPQTVAPTESSKSQEENVTHGEKVDYQIKLFDKVFSKDEEGAEAILSEWLSKAADEKTKNDRLAIYQDIRRAAGRADAFDKLEKISLDNATHYLSRFFLAQAYEEMGQHDRARCLFLDASKIVEKTDEKVLCYVLSAKNISKMEKFDEAVNFLEEKISEIHEPKLQAKMYEGLADIYKDLKLHEVELTCLEKAVYLAPSNHQLRFRLAYNYGDLKKNAQSLFHYDILSKEAPNGTNLNNLGVAYAELKLDAKSIAAYTLSADLKETLAMANLAYKLISSGFIDEAKTFLTKARGADNCHKNISSAEAKIAEVVDNENKRKEEILKSTKQERDFRIAFADALTQSVSISDISGKWKTPHGDLNFKVDKAIVHASERIADANAFMALINPSFAALASAREVTFSGNRHNRTLSGKFTIRREPEEKGRASILGGESPAEYKILGIITSDSLINVMQTNSSDEISFLKLEKIIHA